MTVNTTGSAPETAGVTRANRIAGRAGLVLSVLIGLFLLFDAVSKLLASRAEVAAADGLGFTAGALPVMGALLLLSVVLYAVPRTSVFGAVLITAYLGGAFGATLRVHAQLFPVLLAPVLVAVPVWLGLYLRSPALRRLVHSGL